MREGSTEVTVSLKYRETVPLGWQQEAACRSRDKNLFFDQEGEPYRARLARARSAQVVCFDCPVRIACLQHALRYPETHGVWGGTTPKQREQLRDNLRRQREARRASGS